MVGSVQKGTQALKRKKGGERQKDVVQVVKQAKQEKVPITD